MNILDMIGDLRHKVLCENRVPKYLYIGTEDYCELMNEVMRYQLKLPDTSAKRLEYMGMEIVHVNERHWLDIGASTK